MLSDEPPKEQIPDDSLALVIKGGGIKGLAYVGALQVLVERYRFSRYVGTSAGAVTAVLLAAGYSPIELKAILEGKNFKDFFDAPWYSIPFNIVFHKGMHPADAFTNWIDHLLSKKLQLIERVKLSNLPKRVTIYASCGGKRVLKFDSYDNDADAAHAVRCSMSIPFVFIPQLDQGLLAFDGGLRNNYPVDELLRKEPDIRFISLYLGAEMYEPPKSGSVISNLLSILIDAGEREAVTEHRARTVIIDPRPVSTLEFQLTESEKSFLLSAGKLGALKHLNETEQQAAEQINHDKLREQVVSSRKEKYAKRKRHKFLVAALLVVAFAAILWLVWLKPIDNSKNHLIFNSGMDLKKLSTDRFNYENPGTSVIEKRLEIDLRNRIDVPASKLDSSKISPSIQTYEIRAMRTDDAARYFAHEFASQRKLLDIECISDHPHSVWFRVDSDPLGESFKNVWTLIVDLEQHARDIPFVIRFRIIRYNAYQSEDLNFVGHLVSQETPLIETNVLLPNGYVLEEDPILQMKKSGVKGNKWEPFNGDADIRRLNDGSEFVWILRDPVPGMSYIAKIDWMRL